MKLRGPLLIAVNRIPATNKTLPRLLDTLRLFIECIDLSDAEDDDGWDVLIEIVEQNTLQYCDREATFALFNWMVRLISDDVKRYFINAKYAEMLLLVVIWPSEDITTLVLSLGPDKAIEVRPPGGYSVLLTENAYGNTRDSQILSYGPDPHASGIDSWFSPRLETPTSLAMYSSWAFWGWRDTILNAKIDMATFIGHEIDKGPLTELGWEYDTLHTLFSWDFDPDFLFEDYYSCDDCSALQTFCRVQPFWMHLLEIIRQNIYRYVPYETGSRVDDHLCESVSDILEEHDTTEMIDASDPNIMLVTNEYVNTTPLKDVSAKRETLEPETAIPATETGASTDESQEARPCIHCWLDLHWGDDTQRYSDDGIIIEPELNTSIVVTDTDNSEPHILEDETDFRSQKPKKENKTEESDNDDAPSPQRIRPCLYERGEVVCMDCWLYYMEKGTRRTRSTAKENQSATDSDSLSEEDYTPFVFPS